MRIDVVTLFPDFVLQVIQNGVIARAAQKKLIDVHCWNPREFSTDKHQRVDDRPYGGGPGMVMTIQPLADTLNAVKLKNNGKVVYLSPQGKQLSQRMLQQSATQKSKIFICGRYEGIDQRFLDYFVDEEWSIGDYVISGGELAAMVCIDAITRLIPGSLGSDESAEQDSFGDGLLDCPHYTRPNVYQGHAVPNTLLNGNHQAVEDWRDQQKLGQTWLRRPDMIHNKDLTIHQQTLLEDFINKQKLV